MQQTNLIHLEGISKIFNPSNISFVEYAASNFYTKSSPAILRIRFSGDSELLTLHGEEAEIVWQHISAIARFIPREQRPVEGKCLK